MDIKFEKPKVEPLFQAEIYRTMRDNKEEYRVVIGREGTEVPPTVGQFIDYHAISDFTNRSELEAWVSEQVQVLEKEGKMVEFDESLSYIIARAVDELANESQSRRPQALVFRIGLN